RSRLGCKVATDGGKPATFQGDRLILRGVTNTGKDAAGDEPSGTSRRFRVRDYVRWGDVDQAGIIFYGAYVRFFEIAEAELFRAAGFPYSQLFDRFDLWLPRVQIHFEFHKPALLDDLLEVEVWIGSIGRTSIRLDFEVRRGPAEITADGHVVMVAIDR